MRMRLLFGALLSLTASAATLRPPATPLVVHDPYFSVWSMADHLTDQVTKHWTGTDQPMAGLVRIDGRPFRFMGPPPRNTPLAEATDQVSREVTPTRTLYGFEAAGVRLELTFLTPAFANNLDVLSRPVTYLTWEVKSTDSKPHAVTVYFDASSMLAVNTADQRVACSRVRLPGMQTLRVGTTDQQMLAKSGDNLRIDWGYLYLAVPDQPGVETAGTNPGARKAFLETGKLPAEDDLDNGRQVVLAATFDLGSVGTAPVSRHLMLAYDDFYSIQYLQRNLRPYWRRNGWGASELLTTAAREYADLNQRAKHFDDELTAELVKAGGEKYAAVAVLAYRQALAAHKLVADIDGTPMYFSKENFSNGCIDTVDVTYPSAPLFLLLNPQLLKGQLVPIFEYSSLPRWRFPFAPHDLGTYPLANGQVYGGGEKTEEDQMPVEESGNLLILTAALAKAEGNAALAQKYWPVLSKWANYLKQKGLDPENQLSTDDFAGHLAHNTNLSLKAILALRSYAMLAGMVGKKDVEAEYLATVKNMAAKWEPMAADGDHYKLAFDRSGTWSQKYNLVWDKLLGFGLFDPQIARKELAFYKTKQNVYGMPLDNRATYTKLDWIVWTATLADNPADFAALVEPLYKFADETPSRVPLNDWYDTIDAKQRGFQARSVVGGVFIKLLEDPATWKKWAGRSEPAAAAAVRTAVVPNRAPLIRTPYTLLPLGSVKPEGWLARQLRIQADGLTGHIEDVWPDLGPNSAWLGGPGEGWERGPYYLDGLVPLAYQLDDPRLIERVRKWMNWTLANQRPDGGIGPAKNTDWWPNYVMLKALTQYQEATGDPRVIPLMEKYFAYMAANLDARPLKEWAIYRWQDQVLTVLWLYNRNGDPKLLDLARKLKGQGFDWAAMFTDMPYRDKVAKADTSLKTHGVNNAQGMKTSAVWYQVSGAKSDLDGLNTQFAQLDKYQGLPNGLFSGDEHFAGHSPVQGSELCLVVEGMYSMENILAVTGNPSFGDRLEKWAYNALPGTFTKDMWAHQYDQQPNQVLVNVAMRDWETNGPDSNLFGLEPNFGCCTANMHQGWPKFVSSLWMASREEGLAAMAYAPSRVTASVRGGIPVTIVEETEYPFRDSIRLTVNPESPVAFPLDLRIPAWAAGARVSVNGKPVSGAKPGSFFKIDRKWAKDDRVELVFPMKPRVSRWYNDSIAVDRGPLVYSLRIGEEWAKVKDRPQVPDWGVKATTAWNYALAIDPRDPSRSILVDEKLVGAYPFSAEGAPVELKVKARKLPGWGMQNDSAAAPPQSPVKSAEPEETVTLIPYGSAKLRITAFPLLQ